MARIQKTAYASILETQPGAPSYPAAMWCSQTGVRDGESRERITEWQNASDHNVTRPRN